jgi:hypothetical protein
LLSCCDELSTQNWSGQGRITLNRIELKNEKKEPRYCLPRSFKK